MDEQIEMMISPELMDLFLRSEDATGEEKEIIDAQIEIAMGATVH